jgi:hypothetical protein
VTKRRVILGVGAAVVLALAAFVIWAETPFAAGPEAIAALATDARVQLATDKWIAFEPAAPPARTGFVETGCELGDASRRAGSGDDRLVSPSQREDG